MIRRRVLGSLAALLVVVGLVVAEIVTSGSGQGSRPAPTLPTQVLNPPGVTLSALNGKPALINFWASWCPPCKKEAPELQRFAKGLHGNAALIGVDWNDSASNARSFIADNHLSYPILRDPTGAVGNDYRLQGLPTTYVLDPEGRIVQTLTGPQTVNTLDEALRSVVRS